ncbi:hypothetical protein BC938DRAFT_470700 [Jimgerdemannia flammicorona]|uniref:Uncharacterized protein n=1 Tax=Jimgerdemannia flammicorona TaxID=994334 RepID=A0A433Q9Q5_9FUNG|nr:hypothetical protein BC938DRAFT_470700 [Jimgerdemannia flammicorona]
MKLTRRQHSNQNNGVDQIVRPRSSRPVEHEREWRRGNFAGLIQQAGVVVRQHEANHKDGNHVEEQDTPENLLDGLWHGLLGVLGLASSDTNNFRAVERKRRRDEYLEDTQEPAIERRALDLPVAHADVIVACDTSVDEDSNDDEGDARENFDQGEPVSVETHNGLLENERMILLSINQQTRG